MREYEIHKKLQHPRVVHLLDLFEIDDNSFGTVQELCDGGDLDWHLKQHQVPACTCQDKPTLLRTSVA